MPVENLPEPMALSDNKGPDEGRVCLTKLVDISGRSCSQMSSGLSVTWEESMRPKSGEAVDLLGPVNNSMGDVAQG